MTRSSPAHFRSVPVSRSREQLETALLRYGITEFGISSESNLLRLTFKAGLHHHRIVIPLPSPNEARFLYTSRGHAKSPKASQTEFEQQVRCLHRALRSVVIAKLELAQLLGQPVETAFAEYRVLDHGKTVQEMVMGPEADQGLWISVADRLCADPDKES